MRRLLLISSAILLILSLSFCSDDGNPVDPNKESNLNAVSFLAAYEPKNDKVLGDEPLVALLKYENGKISYSAFLNAYPPKGMVNNADINNNILAMGLHSDFNDIGARGVYMDLSAENAFYLPLVEASQESDYSYFNGGTANVSDNGYVIYSSATNDKYYGDEYRPFLVRFNPSNDQTDIAISPKAFALGQPEKGSDTEMAQFNRNIFCSPDGKYAYGHLEAYGTEGGGIHWDYNILFKYDFDAEEYTRLGDVNDDDVSIIAMGSDRTWILYTNNYDYKVLNLTTGNIANTTMNTVNVKKNSWGPNGACVGSTARNLWYKDFVNNSEIVVCQTDGTPSNTMFSESGNKIFFTLSDYTNKYLCVTESLEEGCNYDTLGTIPLEFYDMIMIK